MLKSVQIYNGKYELFILISMFIQSRFQNHINPFKTE